MRGRDIKRYGFDFADLWLINTHNGIKDKGIPPVDINNYPAVKAHLDLYWDKISVRNDKGDTPYNLRNCVYTDDFSKQKIVWKRIGSDLRFCYDEQGMFCLDSTCFATGNRLKFLTLLLNSPLGRYLLKDSPKTGTGDLLVSVQAIEPILVPFVSIEQNKNFEDMYNNLQFVNEIDQEAYEYEINIELCKLYQFSDDEVDYISTF